MAVFTIPCEHDSGEHTACDDLAITAVTYWIDLLHDWQRTAHTCTAHIPATLRAINPARVNSILPL